MANDLTPGFSTWEALRTDGAVLLIVNSRPDASAEVDTVFAELDRLAGRAVHVVAAPSWRQWAIGRGVTADRVRYTVDAHGGELEVNYFLETPAALAWAHDKQFWLVVSSVPHGLYNEEVKTLFEQRVALLLRDGWFLTHALPERGIYLFDLAALLQRFGRESKRRAYDAACRSLMNDLYQTWRDQGSPAAADGADCPAVDALLARHLGGALLSFDEQSPIPLPHHEDVTTPAAAMVRYLSDVIVQRDEAFRQAVHEHEAALDDCRRSASVRARLSRWFLRR